MVARVWKVIFCIVAAIWGGLVFLASNSPTGKKTRWSSGWLISGAWKAGEESVLDRIVAAIVLGSLSTGAATAQTAKSLDDVAAELGLKSTRGIDSDICYPANAREYQALGKNGILMLTSQTAISTELPLRSAYLIVRNVRVPLQRVLLLKPHEVEGKTVQTSFYLIPLKYMKGAAQLKADFKGERSGFGVMSFTVGGSGLNMPDFVKLDEYDQPHDADPEVVSQVIAREYPDQVGEG